MRGPIELELMRLGALDGAGAPDGVRVFGEKDGKILVGNLSTKGSMWCDEVELLARLRELPDNGDAWVAIDRAEVGDPR